MFVCFQKENNNKNNNDNDNDDNGPNLMSVTQQSTVGKVEMCVCLCGEEGGRDGGDGSS